MRLKDKIVFLTGAANGMGESHARRAIAEGAKLIMTDIATEAGEKLAAELGDHALFIEHDISSEEQWANAVKIGCEHFGGIDILVNNAGILTQGDIQSETADTLRKVLDINVVGTWLGIRTVSPIMIERGKGSIINVASQVGYRGWNNYSVYGCSKWAIRGLTKHMAMELAPKNVRVNSILPGAVDETGLFSSRVDDDLMEKMKKTIPLRRFVSRDQVSSLMVYLASDESDATTGTDNLIDCGVSI